MPDTSIDNRELFLNVAKKADALGLDSLVLWNVTRASLCLQRRIETIWTRETVANSRPYYGSGKRAAISQRPGGTCRYHHIRLEQSVWERIHSGPSIH